MFLRWGMRLWLMAELRTLFGHPQKVPERQPLPLVKEADAM